MRNLAQALPYARELKEQGKTKYIGITHYQDSAHAEARARDARGEARLHPDQLFGRCTCRPRGTLFPAAQELGVAVMVNRAFDDGKLFARGRQQAAAGLGRARLGVTSWAQLFLKFAISHPAVTVVIPATGKPERQADNLKAGAGALLTQAQQDELVKMFA